MVMTGFPPYGYYREGKRETAQLIINEPEAQVVRQIFNWYVSNNGDGRPLSLREITKRLISTGEPTPHYRKGPAQYWTPSTVNNILNNETYAGIAYYGKSRVVKVKGKKLKIKTPPEEWIKIEIPQLAIIDHKIFDLAQERGERNKQLAKRNRKREYLLAGFFRCGTCGATMSGGPAGGRKHRHYMYRCVTFWTRPGQQICMTGNRVVPMKRADERVWKWVENILVDAENLEIGLRRMVEMRKNETGPKRQRLNMVEDLITKAERKIERLIRTLEDEEDEYLITELRSSLKTASKMRDSLVNERDTLSYEVEEQEITPEKIDLVKQRAAEIRYKLIDPTYAQKRIVLDMVRLECVYRVDENGNRWIDAKCDLLPEGVLIELPLSSIAS
jgi:site-specific DNA recombinase